MTKLLGSLMIAGLLSGCIVRTHDRRHGGSSARRMSKDCPPAHHWNGYTCVHNGRGHGKAKGRR